MKKLVIVLLIGAGIFMPGSFKLDAQDLTLGSIYEKENVPYRRPVPLPFLREADVVWSKMIWRMVDLREKVNHPLYFPTEPFGPRMSLIDVLMTGLENEEITAYTDEQFQVPRELEDVQRLLGAEDELRTVVDVDTGEEIVVEIEGEVRTDEVFRYLILEQWYFDRQHSRFDSRIIGLCPIRVFQRRTEDGELTDEQIMSDVFWVYYPEIRELLARHEVFFGNNDLASLSFDDLFLQRRFSGFIYRESNVYDNRRIEDYTMGRDALYEAARIHNMIFDFEQDLWEY
ncbi:MAG: gliding motility protein GldN [Marinilabiliales bacterium]|nr:MAG: gliding motility protein GldN [Marinilabiliales bacterium]